VDLSFAAAEYISELAETAVNNRGIFTLVLSGGNTPRLLYEHLAKEEFAERIPWQHTHLFWGDERCLSPDHPDSNFALASKALISRVPVPSENVHRISAETAPPKAAAESYERTLREFFQIAGGRGTSPSFPSFDLVLLGLGADGHTASLFPGDVVLEEKTSWVLAVRGTSASPPVLRITLTLPVINEARCVLFLASGSKKRKVFREILDNPKAAAQLYPAARVRPSGRLLWFIDQGLA
jgi:6-phosphogluconolactonase